VRCGAGRDRAVVHRARSVRDATFLTLAEARARAADRRSRCARRRSRANAHRRALADLAEERGPQRVPRLPPPAQDAAGARERRRADARRLTGSATTSASTCGRSTAPVGALRHERRRSTRSTRPGCARFTTACARTGRRNRRLGVVRADRTPSARAALRGRAGAGEARARRRPRDGCAGALPRDDRVRSVRRAGARDRDQGLLESGDRAAALRHFRQYRDRADERTASASRHRRSPSWWAPAPDATRYGTAGPCRHFTCELSHSDWVGKLPT